MSYKRDLRTLRLTPQEGELFDRYLEQNPAIESFSALARIALFDFIAKRGSIPLHPIVEETGGERPSFLWDYDLSDGEIREALEGPAAKRRWLVARILEHARFEDVWRYLTPRQVERDLPYLRLPKKIKDHWEYALARWRRASQ